MNLLDTIKEGLDSFDIAVCRHCSSVTGNSNALSMSGILHVKPDFSYELLFCSKKVRLDSLCEA
jgi:hypothetical protein